MNWIESLLGRSGLLPHGYCISNSPGLLWSMVLADGLIAVAYFSIPLAILSFMRKRSDIAYPGLAWLFSGFIFACGITHVMDVWVLWWPDYAVQTLAKISTALISLTTAVATWRLIPKAVQIPSSSAMRSAIQKLEAEVAQRRSAEEQLADVQENLAVTLASIGAGFLATDRQGCVTRMNSVAERLLGWTQAEARGRIVWEVFDREGRPESFLRENPVDVMVREGYSIDVGQHVMSISRNGARTPVEVKAALTRADDGSVRGMALVMRDMTRAMLADAESARLAAIVESSNDAIIGKTLDGRITSWNRAAQKMFGYSADEVLGQSVQMLIPPDRLPEEMRILADLSRGASVPPFDTVRRARDGRLLQVSLSISPIRDARGQIIGASKIARDITAQRQAEAALRDSEAQLRFTLESAQVGDWDLDLDTGQMQRSLRHDMCFGYSAQQPGWTRDTLLAHVHPEDRSELARQLDVAVSGLGRFSAEFRVIWADGSVHWLRSHGTVRHEGDLASRLTGIVVDITPQRHAEQVRLTAQRLQVENRQIQAASRLKSQFLANMSHELRTPLNAIIGFADLLHAGVVPVSTDKHREYLGHIGSSGRHLLQLINDVLDLSKVEAGKMEFFPQPVDLQPLLGDVRNVLQTSLQGKQIELHTEIAEDLDGLRLDPARLKQVLYNYLSNAIKFTPVGGRVTVRAWALDAQRWRLEVQDTGIGIAPADLQRLFSDFQQLDSGYDKRHQGTGLGLALTRRLVQAQGGSVGVRSVLGEGSVFHFEMDRAPAMDGLAEAGHAARRRVLVIEDDTQCQDRLMQALASVGCIVDGAASAEQASFLAAGQDYAALTLDLALPESGGLQLLERIRNGGASVQTPVVGLSLPVDAHVHATFPVADVLSKPLRTDQLRLALDAYGHRQPEPARVLVVDDDPAALDLMQATLQGLGITAICLNSGEQALRELDMHRPDAMVLDLMMPGFDGFAVVDALQGMPAWRALPVYIWTSMMLSDEEFRQLTRSARAILNKGGGTVEPLLASLSRSFSANAAAATAAAATTGDGPQLGADT